MQRITYTILAVALLSTTAITQIASRGQGAPVQPPRRPSAPSRGLDLTCMNAAQRSLWAVMVKVQFAGIRNEEISPTSRRIVMGMNYVMRSSLTPEQQKLLDAQIWQAPGNDLGKEWDRVRNCDSQISRLARLSESQQAAISLIHRRCSADWNAFDRVAGPNPSPARRVEVMFAQQEPILQAVRERLTEPQRAEWDRFVQTFRNEMRTAVEARP